jgi:elongation factor G
MAETRRRGKCGSSGEEVLMGIRPQDVRNVAVVGHKGVGKTSLIDAMLYIARAVARLGSGVLDDTPEEREHATTLEARVARLKWGDAVINLIDVPGDASLQAETRYALAAADAALLVISAADGVQSGTERAFRLIHEAGLPCLGVLTKVDDDSARVEEVVKDAHQRFKEPVDPMEVALGFGSRYRGVVTVVPPKAWIGAPEGPTATPSPVPAEVDEAVRSARAHLVDDVAGTDDALTDKYLTDGDLTPADLEAGLFADVAQGKLLPVYFASAVVPSGIVALLDAIVSLLPPPAAPLDEPAAAFIWKTHIDPHIGRISWARVRSGVLNQDVHLSNSRDGSRERIGQLLTGLGRELGPVGEAVAGDIVAISKLKATGTGDTISDEKHPVTLPRPELPPALYSRALQPDERGKDDKLGAALLRLAEEDPGLVVSHDETGHELVVSGSGPFHLELTLERLRRKSGLGAHLGSPRIAYRETITRKVATVEGKQKKQTGGHGQYGVCYIDIEPLPRGAGFQFENAIVGGVIPRQFVPSVEKGVQRAMERGALAGYRVVDVKVRLVDGKTHSVDSSDAAFQAAGFKAFRAAVAAAHPVLLEPIVKLQVSVPDGSTGDALGEINARRGKVVGTDTDGEQTVITAWVPLAETLDFEPKLASMTRGKGTFTLSFDHYDVCPEHVRERVTAQSGYHPKEEED